MENDENSALDQSKNESIPEELEQELDSQAENAENMPANTPADVVYDTEGKTAILTGSKKIINILLKNPQIAIPLVAGGFIIFIAIFLAAMDSSGVNDYVYQAPTCETVTVHYDPYGPGEEETFSMDLEDYVRSAVYAYTRDLTTSTASTYHLYFSLSVVLRNEAMTHDCEVTYRDKVIPRTLGEVDYYFDLAMENSYGIAMVDENEEFVETTVSSFCWSSQGTITDHFGAEATGYTLYQPGGMGVPTDFVTPYFDNRIYQNCECNLDSGVETITREQYNNQDQCYMYWYTEEELEDGTIRYHYYREYQHQDNDDPVGYSLYAANYLYRTGSNYNLILNYFYGDDIVLRTTQEENSRVDEDWNSFNNGSCMWWPIGSDETTRVDGVEMASGAPSTVEISSYFGPREAPTAGASSDHKAIDIANGVDGQTNIIAVASGRVVSAVNNCVAGDTGCSGGLGNFVRIEHDDGTVTRYGHMQSVSVSVGDSVVQGQVIGKMGHTGVVTGTHLDFQILVNGVAVNPLDYVNPSNPRPTGCGIFESTFTGTTRQEFIDFIAPYAVADMHSSNILASITIAQAILESGDGGSSLAREYNNYFGMKAGSSWTGETVSLPTQECRNDGTCYSTVAVWRVYSSPLDSIRDHSNLLSNSNRYSAVVGERDYVTAINIIKNGGYATDPLYVQKITSIIEDNNLTQYDNA